MKRQKIFLVCLIVICMVVVSFVFASLRPWKCGLQGGQSRSFTIAKAWWPVWDTFQIGIRQREKLNKSFQTTFIQAEDYVSALNDFQTGNVDAATLTIYEAILAASKGVPLRIILLLDYTTGSDGVVAKKSIRSLTDLKGKHVGVEQGTIAHFTLLKALEKAGLDTTEVQLVNLNLDELKQAFLHDKVEAVGTYEPYISELVHQGDGHVIFSSQEIPRAICDVLFVREKIARDHPEVIDHWIKAWNDALNFKGSEPENYTRTLNRLNGTPIPDIKEAFKGIFFTNLAENRLALGTSDKPGYLLESMREMQEFMLKQGVIQQRLHLQDLIEFEGIQRFFDE